MFKVKSSNVHWWSLCCGPTTHGLSLPHYSRQAPNLAHKNWSHFVLFLSISHPQPGPGPAPSSTVVILTALFTICFYRPGQQQQEQQLARWQQQRLGGSSALAALLQQPQGARHQGHTSGGAKAGQCNNSSGRSRRDIILVFETIS